MSTASIEPSQARFALPTVNGDVLGSAIADTSSIDAAIRQHALSASFEVKEHEISLSPPSTGARSVPPTVLAAALAGLARKGVGESSLHAPAMAMQSLIRHGTNDGKDNATVFRAAIDEKLAELVAACQGDARYAARVDDLCRDTPRTAIEGAEKSSASSNGRSGIMPFDTDPMFAILMALTQLQLLLGQAEREHRAQQQEQQIIRAFAGAEKLVKEAKSQMIGSIGAASLSIGVASVGVSRVAKGTKLQRDSIRHESLPSAKLSKAGMDVDIRVKSTPTPTAAGGAKGGSPASTDAAEIVNESERVASAADIALAQKASHTATEAARQLQLESRLAGLRGGQMTTGGAAIGNMAGVIGNISSASFQMNAASHGRDGAMLRAEAEVAAREQEKASAMVDAHEKLIDDAYSVLKSVAEQQSSVVDHIARNTA